MDSLASILIGIPLLTSLMSFLVKSSYRLSILNIFSAIMMFVTAVFIGNQIFTTDYSQSSQWYVFDSLSGFSILLASTISLLVYFYSASYLNSLKKQEAIDDRVFHNYYLFTNLFVAMMLTLSLMNNIGLSWIAIEGTTLSSALLLGLYRQSRYLEAAWKYIIICTVGIIIALLGITLFLTSSLDASTSDIFIFSKLMDSSFLFNPKLLKIAFVLIFIGIGTKLGLVPMHTWLLDAYQNSPSPVTVLMTSSLSSLVLIPLLRYKFIVDTSLGSQEFSSRLFYFFGFVSIISTAIFLVNQFDLKRLLAYSSIENMGFVVMAIGIGNGLALSAVFLHVIFHALTKAVLFFCSGNLFLQYHSHNFQEVRKVFKRMHLTAWALMLGIFSILGLPPFGIFVSKFLIIREVITDNMSNAIVVLLALACVFGSFIHYFNKLLFLEVTEGNHDCYKKQEISFKILNITSIAIPLLLLLSFGLFIPEVLREAISKMVLVLTRVSL